MVRRRFQILTKLVSTTEMRDLLFADWHTAEVARERCSMIISRTQLSARLFAILTVSWILVDTLTISWPLWGFLAIDRLLAAAGFLILARYRFKVETVSAANRGIAAFVGIAIGFFLSASIMFWSFPSNEQSMFATTTYFYAPFLIATGLGIFPLTILESAVLAAPVFGAMTLSIFLIARAVRNNFRSSDAMATFPHLRHWRHHQHEPTRVPHQPDGTVGTR
jgi:hypothetical protein